MQTILTSVTCTHNPTPTRSLCPYKETEVQSRDGRHRHRRRRRRARLDRLRLLPLRPRTAWGGHHTHLASGGWHRPRARPGARARCAPGALLLRLEGLDELLEEVGGMKRPPPAAAAPVGHARRPASTAALAYATPSSTTTASRSSAPESGHRYSAARRFGGGVFVCICGYG